ncbi:MAG: substrate-binding domain-containing protein [Betaproteobacteria bacterium]
MKQLHVLSAGAAKGLVLAMQESFASNAAAELRCTFGAVGAIRDELLGGKRCDVVILTAAVIDALAAVGEIGAGIRASLGRVYTAIAVPEAQAAPDVATAEGLRDALLSASGIYLPDPLRATAGIHFAGVLRTLGIYEEVQSRLRPFPSGAVAMRMMADAGEYNAIGCTQVTEIRYTVGVALAGLLPREFELATAYAVAVGRRAEEPALATQFAAALAGSGSLALRREGGFIVD